LSDRSEGFSASHAIFSRWAQTFSGSGLEVRFAWGSRGDVQGCHDGVVNCPGAEAKRCEWWIENMQRQDVHRRREFSLLLVFWLFRIAHFLA
jgi:hypothetical protein